MKVLIITEGSRNIGFGHITRCTSLYQAFVEKNIEPEFIINSDETVEGLLTGKRYKIFNWLEEKEKIYTLIKETDIIIIDSYFADYDFYKRISDSAKVTAYIDDNKRIDYPKGIIINGSIYAKDMNYPEKEGITNLLGSEYTLLRREFWDIPEKKINENIETIMITFGGEDVKNMTLKILELIKKKYPDFKKKVIIGKGFKNIEIIKQLQNKNTELIYYPDAEGMKKAMLESDMAISAGGQTLNELAAIGVPTIAIAVAENQINNVTGWKKAEFIEYAGWWEEENLLENILKSVKKLMPYNTRTEKIKIGKTLINNSNPRKIINILINKAFEN